MTARPTHTQTDQLRDHWWWRPGWRVGRQFYTWHLTFNGQRGFHALVDAWQQALRPLPGLDLVPHQWLHLTMQGVGFTDEIPEPEVRAILDAARTRLAALPAPDLTFHRPTIYAEAIPLTPNPAGPVHAIRGAIRDGIADVWGPDRVPEPPDGFRAHVSMAYSNTAAPTAPVAAALDQVDADPVIVTIRETSLIVLNRDHRMYEWQNYATAPLRV